MSDSRVHDAITALVTALNAAPTVTALATVYDGPFVTGDTPATAVHVGYDGDPAGEMNATTGWVQDWAGLGQLHRNETFTVLCCVISWSGDVDVPTRRAAALAVLSAVAGVLRDAANAGLSLPQPTIAEFASGELFQEQGRDGLQARIPFGVRVRTRV